MAPPITSKKSKEIKLTELNMINQLKQYQEYLLLSKKQNAAVCRGMEISFLAGRCGRYRL